MESEIPEVPSYNIFEFIANSKNNSISKYFEDNPSKKISLEWNMSSSSLATSEDYLNAADEIRKTLKLDAPVSIAKKCDLCQAALSLTNNSTYIKCGQCQFGNDLCWVCRSNSDILAAYVDPEKEELYECFEGVGCCDHNKIEYFQSVGQVQEAPF